MSQLEFGRNEKRIYKNDPCVCRNKMLLVVVVVVCQKEGEKSNVRTFVDTIVQHTIFLQILQSTHYKIHHQRKRERERGENLHTHTHTLPHHRRQHSI
jgi:hypothetical protein